VTGVQTCALPISPEPLGQTGAGPVATLPPDATPSGLAAGCSDFQSCLGQYAIIVIIGAVALLGGGVLLWQRLASGGNSPGFPTGNLTDKLAPIDSSKYDTAATLDADKLAPIDSSKYDTAGTLEADKLAPIDSSKYDTAGTLDADKLAPIGESLPALEPASSPLPPPPGSTLG